MSFNTKQYQWSDVTVMIGGRDIKGIRGVKYTAKQEKEAVYAKGDKPFAIQRGNKMYEGEISVLQSELETLIAASPTGDINDLSFNILVEYGDPAKGNVSIKDELQFCEFTEAAHEVKQGDKFMEITLPIIFLDIVRVS